MAISNKSEIEIFYKTHHMSIKDVASHFNVSYRTLAHWVKTEGWVAGCALEGAREEMAQGVVQENLNAVLDIAKVKAKNAIKKELGSVVSDVDSLVLDNLLESSTDEILSKALSLNFIQKNIALAGIIAKDRLLRLVRMSENPKDDPMIIACAEKVAKIFGDMQQSVYGKNPQIENKQEDLSIEEIDRLLEQLG